MVMSNYIKYLLTNRAIIILAIFIVILNGFVYTITKQNAEDKIQMVLEENSNRLQIHYEILLQTQKITSKAMYKSTINQERLIEIITEANSATKEKKTLLRNELHKLLADKYEISKGKGVLQYHFVLPNNESFLRMHKPSKFGDDLSDIRYDFNYTNRTKKPIRGFTQGRTAHGFRNTFPIFGKNGKYIGAMEISFSSDSFQWYLNNISHIHTHFLVYKKIFDAKAWKRNDLILNYLPSAENPNYMLTLGKIHSIGRCTDDKRIMLKPVKEEIARKMLQDDIFSLYLDHNKNSYIISFLPINNLEGSIGAWLVSYTHSYYIPTIFKGILIMRFAILTFSLIFLYFVYKQIQSRELLIKSHDEIIILRLRQQSRLVQMGEMLSMIAHQWRQPLAAIGSRSAALELKANLGKADKETVIEQAQYISKYAQHLSQTIDDFRNFFKSSKELKESSYNEIIGSVLDIVGTSIENKNIAIIQNLSTEYRFLTYPNELKQVVLNIIKNAEDVLLEKNIKDPKIRIVTYKKDGKNVLEIHDNAGGVPTEIIDKIFDPYFSTKLEKNGTGIGLYMSKTIVEEHCSGTLSITNDESGAVFKVELAKKNDE
ncbi:MAG: hypothetical protein DRG30_02900 [Epsilonproteobacteria bacterium]|nr:MAG: hypothetical protein DRG30_02900 [Campylobacterota bacterium]